jgi:hypothetical protein
MLDAEDALQLSKTQTLQPPRSVTPFEALADGTGSPQDPKALA